ncbi:RNA-dependent RNA polymerase [Mycena chlorophos]|uniref:RNA-dependent RNA polymerase n=1 Tax=Mycena chlorophos TaxID=658473 RepID=A0A8H6WKX5_MYCCL|nr:RNA-dependent RNA polymerase [Mycena chlorophos]
MSKVLIRNLENTADTFDVTKALAAVLHSDEFRTFAKLGDSCEDEEDDGPDVDGTPTEGALNRKLLNFTVELNQSTVGTTRNNGTVNPMSPTGMLSLPNEHVRSKLLEWLSPNFGNAIRVLSKKIKLARGPGTMERQATLLSKTPYVDPQIERDHQAIIDKTDESLRVDVVQFGCYYRQYPPRPLKDKEPIPPRQFSVEWQREYFNDSAHERRQRDGPSNVAWLKFEYDHKRVVIKLGDETTEYEGALVILTFASISKVAIGYDPKPYICFDTLTPPVLEAIKFHRTLTGDADFDNRRSKIRIGSLEPGHLRVAPYAHQIRLVLYNDPNRDMVKVFAELCLNSGFPDSMIFRLHPRAPLEAVQRNFFSAKRLHKLEVAFRSMDWPIVFQLEALLHNGLLDTDEVELFIPRVKTLREKKVEALRKQKIKAPERKGTVAVGHFLQEFIKHLGTKSMRESPAECFDRLLKTLPDYQPLKLQGGAYNCRHVTVTPTRMIFDGPYPVQSNRVIRKYEGNEDDFIRVDFRDEDRLNYRWARDVDGSQFVRERVGKILKNGLFIGGRRFEFLAYSTSALRGHAVWFMSPFKDPNGTLITSESIRKSLGDFAGTPLLKSPSKYAARLAQAFTATDPSIKILRSEWEEVPDIVDPGFEDIDNPPARHVHTDGVGTISRKLAQRIWEALCEARHRTTARTLTPDAFQIRFLGYKGVVGVDSLLDDSPDGIHMRLRRSMRKFDSEDEQKENAEIEIAMAFEKPSTAYLNRPLVMALEDRHVRQEAFMKLQDFAIADARTIDDGIMQFRNFLRNHSLGSPYRLSFILERLEKLGLDLKPTLRMPGIDNPWFSQLRQVSMNNVLHDIKHGARIPIPESHLLVGIADEGPAYKKRGLENVYELPPGKIYACIQRPEDEKPTWLTGSCTISRSPIVHLGDIQRVTAIGEPPAGMLCSFAGLKNVVVLPSISGDSKSPRSLASCLGGGDLDVSVLRDLDEYLSCDLYCVIPYHPLLPAEHEEPASYADGQTLKLDRDSTVDDICDFVVEYINSDVLGLLSDRLLIIADQSNWGMHDESCKRLAGLCSQAVDYPKQGIPVNLEENPLPRLLLRCKPDWHAGEDTDVRKNDYYRSDKALGRLYRAIKLESIVKPTPSIPNGKPKISITANPIFCTLAQEIQRVVNWTPPADNPPPEIENLFRKYVEELRYISVTHTLTTEAGQSLLESEIVIGTILAKSVQKRWRTDCIYRCRYHANALVRDVQKKLWDSGSKEETASLANIKGLERAWSAFILSIKRSESDEFGAKSFGLVALGTIFEWLDNLSGVASGGDSTDAT